MRELDHLAAEVADRLPGGRTGAVPIGLIIVVVQALLQALAVCYPMPTAAHVFLQEPPYGLAGFRQRAWRKRIAGAVAEHWKGDPTALPDVQAAVLARVRAGVSLTTVKRAYAGLGATS